MALAQPRTREAAGLVSGLDWDREGREARKRRHGSIPLWADPAALSSDDEREVQRLLVPMNDLLSEFHGMSRTQRQQRASEFNYRLLKLQSEAVIESARFANVSAREEIKRRGAALVEQLRESS